MRWDFDPGAFKSQALADQLWERASDDRCFFHRISGCLICHPPRPPRSWWERLYDESRAWWDAHYPRLHFGPCPTEEDY